MLCLPGRHLCCQGRTAVFYYRHWDWFHYWPQPHLCLWGLHQYTSTSDRSELQATETGNKGTWVQTRGTYKNIVLSSNALIIRNLRDRARDCLWKTTVRYLNTFKKVDITFNYIITAVIHLLCLLNNKNKKINKKRLYSKNPSLFKGSINTLRYPYPGILLIRTIVLIISAAMLRHFGMMCLARTFQSAAETQEHFNCNITISTVIKSCYSIYIF